MNNQVATTEHLTKIVEFRQALYSFGFTARRDALLELLDALVSEGPVSSFPRLSLSACFRRQWPSLYGAVEDGSLDSAWLHHYLAQQVPAMGIEVFALDSTPWARPRARTLAERQYVYQASQAVNGGSVAVGYCYCQLEWVPQAHASWSLPIDLRRLKSTQTAQEVGAEQVRALAQARQGCEGLDIVAADGKYGNSAFLRSVKGERFGVVARLRRDRVLYRAPAPPVPGKRGRPRVHGERFAFKEPDTWGQAVETVQLADPHWGQVQLQRWCGLHERKGGDVPYEVVRAGVHLEREKPSPGLWLAWQAPAVMPAAVTVRAEGIWRAYQRRWPLEASNRYRKQQLGWTQPQFHSGEACDRWSELVGLGQWLLYLGRPLVGHCRLPWQKPQEELTPQRVQQGMAKVIGTIGSPARPPQKRGKATGWQKGKPRQPKQRFPVVKRGPPKTKAA